MKVSLPKTYQDSGVDTIKASQSISENKEKIESTFSPLVLGKIGGFSGAFDVSFLKNYKNPILLSSSDGVGTKIEFARIFQNYKTIGIDLVAMCVNDILVNGAKPLYFLDYISCEQLDKKIFSEIIDGIVEGCKQSNICLLGGETAEHPNINPKNHYDLAGFVVGACEKEEIILGTKISKDDAIIGIASSGLHSNGFSWIRKLFLDDHQEFKNSQKSHIEWIKKVTLEPTKIYTKSILNLISKIEVKGMVHITGGGFFENIPRVLPQNLSAIISKKSIPPLEVFQKLENDFLLDQTEMFSTFNMGIGFIVIVSKKKISESINILQENGELAFEIGNIDLIQDKKVKIV